MSSVGTIEEAESSEIAVYPRAAIGYRCWDVNKELALTSTGWDFKWRSGHNIAYCQANDHDAPDPDCDCGFYGRYSADVAAEDSYGEVIGAFAARGQAELHGEGFRAAEAEIIGLVNNGLEAKEFEKVCAAYGVAGFASLAALERHAERVGSPVPVEARPNDDPSELSKQASTKKPAPRRLRPTTAIAALACLLMVLYQTSDNWEPAHAVVGTIAASWNTLVLSIGLPAACVLGGLLALAIFGRLGTSAKIIDGILVMSSVIAVLLLFVAIIAPGDKAVDTLSKYGVTEIDSLPQQALPLDRGRVSPLTGPGLDQTPLHHLAEVKDPLEVRAPQGGLTEVYPQLAWKGLPLNHQELEGFTVRSEAGKERFISAEASGEVPSWLRPALFFPPSLVREMHDVIADQPDLPFDWPSYIKTQFAPTLLALGKSERPAWASALANIDNIDQLEAVAFTDAESGESALWRVPNGRRLLSAKAAQEAVRSHALPGRVSSALEVGDPALLIKRGELFYSVDVSIDDGSTRSFLVAASGGKISDLAASTY